MKEKIKHFFFGYDNPVNRYEECPFLAWLVILFLIFYSVWGTIVVFNLKQYYGKDKYRGNP